jgi:uncharacterized lipoprotein YbaY
MKFQNLSRLTGLAALLLLPGTIPAVQAQGNPGQASHSPFQVLRGEVSYRERITFLPGTTLHVLIVKDLPGESGLPVAAMVLPALNGRTPFTVPIAPSSASEDGPFRVRAWIVAGGRVSMRSLAPSTTIESFSEPLHIMMGVVGSNGQTGTGGIVAPAVQKVISGQVEKLDRRGLAPDATVVVELREISGSGAILQVVATQTISLQGKQFPAEYHIEVPASLLHPGKTFDIEARIVEHGQPRYATAKTYSVDTGAILQKLDLLVRPTATRSGSK